MQKRYELTVVFSPELTSAQLKQAQDAISDLVSARKGSVVSSDNWGKKALAYKIKKHADATYVFYVIELETQKAQDLDKAVKLTDGVIRHLLVVQEEKEEK